ncbi:hypothetical protein [Cryobacterium sp. M91]|uniref:hypothetical protein n=1 Tax=Cryobacterium sp. M91 TaxID=2048294 RepID=UPI000CE4E0A5|nr:hypothetical protein [Cryobacterium sp. M91]
MSKTIEKAAKKLARDLRIAQERAEVAAARIAPRAAALAAYGSAVAEGVSTEAELQNMGGYLVTELEAIQADEDRWNSRRGRALFTLGVKRFTGIAHKNNLEAGDLHMALWEAWAQPFAKTADGKPAPFRLNPAIIGARDAWAFTAKEVNGSLVEEHQAQRKQTSRKGLHRIGAAEFSGYSPLLDSDFVAAVDEVLETTGFRTVALKTARALIISHGHSEKLADAVLETMLRRGRELGSVRSAIDALRRERGLADALDFPFEDWKSLVALLFGSLTGGLGLIAAEIEGVPFESVKNVRTATARFGRVAA